MKKLTVSHNDLTEIWPVPPQLEHLVVSYNKLQRIGENVQKLSNLKVIDASYNQITDCAGLHGLAKLQTLNAAGNQIATLEHFETLVSLKECDLRQNKLSVWEIFAPLDALLQLEAVLLEGNPVLQSYRFFILLGGDGL